ncbi:MAG: hypothetical protein NUW07_01250 [Candidatus Saccharicenans sp.]|jgi:hypothetical protein|nr:hypothetical protein [Candidatus Saccharicenans sp.]MDH7492311.1 hypothetical protein [Candidatus Saccharicenans sp.]
MFNKIIRQKFSGAWKAALLVWLLFMVMAQGRGQELLNCLVASVDNIPVTWFDLEVVKAFNLLPGANNDSLAAEDRLEKYIDVLLVLRLTREQLQVTQEEVRAELERLRQGLGEEVFDSRCRALGLKPEDLTGYLQDKILFEKVIGTRFNQRLYVSLKEIEDYYQKVYLPEQKAAGRTPAELVTVLDEIEARLQTRLREQRVKEWTHELRQRAEIAIFPECLKKIR